MTAANTGIPKQQEQEIQVYRDLPRQVQGVVQILSVLYEPAPAKAFVLEFVTSPILDDDEGNPITLPKLRSLIDQLIGKKLIKKIGRNNIKCSPLIAEIAIRDTIELGVFKHLLKATDHFISTPEKNFGHYFFRGYDQAMRMARIFLYNNQTEELTNIIQSTGPGSFGVYRVTFPQLWAQVISNPFDSSWFQTLPASIIVESIRLVIRLNLMTIEPIDDIIQEANTLWEKDSPILYNQGVGVLYAEGLIWQGNWDKASQILAKIVPALNKEESAFGLAAQGMLAFLQGELSHALEQYAAGYKIAKKTTASKQSWLFTPAAMLYIVALLKANTSQDLALAATLIETVNKLPSHSFSTSYIYLSHMVRRQQGLISPTASLEVTPILTPSVRGGSPYLPSVNRLIAALCEYWTLPQNKRLSLTAKLQALVSESRVAGLNWMAAEAAALLQRCNTSPQNFDSQGWWQERGGTPLVDAIAEHEPWELSLQALANLKDSASTRTSAAVADYRLVWLVTYHNPQSWSIQPKEQKVSVKGHWSKGRSIALKRLAERDDSLNYLTPQDHQVCSHIYSEAEYSYGRRGYRSYYHELSASAITALVGHPLVFWDDDTLTRLEVVSGEPELLVQEQPGDRLRLQLSPPLITDNEVMVIKETPTRLKVIELSDRHHHIASILGPHNCLEVPMNAKERVLTAISAVSGIVTVHSDIGGEAADAETVPAHPQPHLHLFPAGNGLKVATLVRPFGDSGPYYPPGSGGATVLAEINGTRQQTQRDLTAEKEYMAAVVNALPPLQRYPESHGEWIIDDLEDCLELLASLQALGDQVIIAWPEGETLRLRHSADTNQFSLRIERQRDWFAASGSLQLGEDQIMDMQQLMRLLSETPSRFIPLGDGQFLELTETFRKRLDELRAISENHGDGVRFHPLVAPALEDLMDDVGDLKADKAWKAHLKRMKSMATLQPEVPPTLQAELRDYQIEGFTWLARLAHWGVGACLADDMGLGKTLQALALILTRAPQGPTLVVAPTSVATNWLSEATKFAPTLNCLTLGNSDRAAQVAQLQPFDLLVCSYGLLQQEDVADLLAEVDWQTIVLDEAQAIKNSATKRSQGAMKLQGGFKLLTTGTPIENHLGELWNLFRFINPGLLGSADRFNEQFASPIERYQDKTARQKLKKLIQPFILRRTKSQVLSELPSRTEVTLQVELSTEERALYEALRREALTKLTETNLEAGAKHLQVLAEIMRLRRACCNPRLVMADVAMPSAKLEVLGEVLTDLLSNRHKALIFSQFVDHLSLIREYLDGQNITYQYLDGRTPAKHRKERVDAFQAGQGDVFLISLKAGGTGLNLTAADYVIHMDPWWNPAVEDQASDRAHRIGQQRPVTIYRLVAQGTIEEQIVSLHQQKRDLADSLLEGTDVSGKISTDDLMKLIQTTF